MSTRAGNPLFEAHCLLLRWGRERQQRLARTATADPGLQAARRGSRAAAGTVTEQSARREVQS